MHILTQTLPGIDPELSQAWLGRRWFCLHPSHLAGIGRWTSIVSSRIGRTDPALHDWPTAFATALGVSARHRETLLVVPGTTTAPWLAAALHLRNVTLLNVEITINESIEQWLQALPCASPVAGPARVPSPTFNQDPLHRLYVSPALSPADPDLDALPLQDRLAMLLGHKVVVLHVRPKGTLDQLLQCRLREDRFPPGTVSVRLSQSASESPRWLERRAVGWYVPAAAQSFGEQHRYPNHCRSHAVRIDTPLVQCSMPLKLMGSWNDYLVHCVRGGQGRSDMRVDRRAILDALLAGRFHQPTSFQTLLSILRDGRLRASSKLLRGNDTMLSFSAVPLPELLARRRYQSHLGRWDWEPYGWLIRRDYLQQLGARPVIYGDQQVYQQLGDEDRPYYQPARRRGARTAGEHWSAEREWRLPDDLRLHQVPSACGLLFVEHQPQAARLARESRWPIIWLQPAETPQLPTAGARRKRSPTQTGRN